MTSITLSRKNLLPSLVKDLFDTGNYFGPRMRDLNEDLLNMDSMPSVNIVENSKDFKIEMAAPGMERKDFKVTVEDDMLTISSEKKEEKKEENENYARREFSYNSFSRSFRLPENCMSDKIDAKYSNGILHIALPKKEVAATKSSREIKVA